MVKVLKNKLKDTCEVKVVFEPGALLNNVIEYVREQTGEFRKKAFLSCFLCC